MIFFGAESGSDWVLKEMQKGITTEETLDDGPSHAGVRHHPRILVCRRQPQRSGARHARNGELHSANSNESIPARKSSCSTTLPRPQPGSRCMETLTARLLFPTARRDGPAKNGWTIRCASIPSAPWLKPRTKKLIDNFETVVASRWPTVQDIRAPRWSRALLKLLSCMALCHAILLATHSSCNWPTVYSILESPSGRAYESTGMQHK